MNLKRLRSFHLLRTILLFFVFCFNTLTGSPPTKQIYNTEQKGFSFIENKGQYNTFFNNEAPSIFFKGQFGGADIFITERGLTYLFVNSKKNRKSETSDTIEYHYSRFDIDLKGAKILKENILSIEPLSQETNFFYSHCPLGIMAVKQYQKIILKNVYPGIDWVLYGSGSSGLKYDFVVYPNADIKQIVLLYKTLEPIKLFENEIKLTTSLGLFVDSPPMSLIKSSNSKVNTSYKVINQKSIGGFDTMFYETEIGFNTESYNLSDTLVIDPLQLWWGTYFGGTNGSEGVAITNDKTGNVYVLGNTNSFTLPVKTYGTIGYFQGSYGGANNGGGFGDLFILKFTKSGQLLWSTYFGGTNIDQGRDITCDSLGNVFILGQTMSVNLPLKNPGGGAYFDATNGASDWLGDFLITKFSSSGTYLWGTYYGGDSWDFPTSICTDKSNNVYCTGSTWSNNFPCYNSGNGAFFQGNIASGGMDDGVILKFSNAGQRLHASFFGGNGIDKIISVKSDLFGNTYFVGNTSSPNLFVLNPGGNSYSQNTLLAQGGNYNGFILKLNVNDQPLWSTYLGGCCSDILSSAVCDKLGNLFVSGNSSSYNFPTVNPGGGAFFLNNNLLANLTVVKFNQQSEMKWSTYFGAFGTSSSFGFLSNGNCNEIYLTFPCHPSNSSSQMQLINPGNGAYMDSTYNNTLGLSLNDIFFAAFSNDGVQKWGTFFGGDGDDLSMFTTVDKEGNIFYTGQQGSKFYYTIPSYQSYTSSCINNPGNGAYFQPMPMQASSSSTSLPLGYQAYCVIGKLIGPSFNSAFTTTGCGNTNSGIVQTSGGWGPYNYNWSNGSLSNSITNVPSGIYTCSVTDNFFGCTSNNTFYVGIPSLTLSFNTANLHVCKGNTVSLSVSGANSFSWFPSQTLNSGFGGTVVASPSITTNYTITGYNAANCKTDTVIVLKVNQLPEINITGNDSICTGANATLTASGGVSFSWSPSNYFMSLNSNTGITSSTHDQIFKAIGADNNGCVDTGFISIKVIPLPKLIVVGSSTLCTGDSLKLNLKGAEKFIWRPLIDVHSLDVSYAILTPKTTQTYTLIGVNNKVCKDSSLVEIEVFQKPQFSILSPDSVCDTTEFYLKTEGDSGLFNWVGADEISCRSCKSTSAKISKPKVFYLTITNKNSCSKTDSLLVNIKNNCEYELIIPNVFTPNNDNINDLFKLRGKNIKDLKCIILTRWGEEVYSFDQLNDYWNGETKNGMKSSEGTYFYTISATDFRNKEYFYKGFLQLVR